MSTSELSAGRLLFGENAPRVQVITHQVRSKLKEMFKHKNFPLRLSDKLIKNAQLSSSLTHSSFDALYRCFEAEFRLFFGVESHRLFALLSSESEGRLDEEEQLNLLSLPLTRLMICSQEVILLGLYDCQSDLRELCDKFRSGLVSLETGLRQKVYDKQDKRLQAKAQSEVRVHAAAATAAQEQLNEFEALKRLELGAEHGDRKELIQRRTQKKLGKLIFHRLPLLKQVLLQEKLLAAANNPREARNCAERYAKICAYEEINAAEKTEELLALKEKQALERHLSEQRCLEAKVDLTRKILHRDAESELEKLKQRQQTVRKLVNRIQLVNASRALKNINSSYANYMLKTYGTLARDVRQVVEHGPSAPKHSAAFEAISADCIGSVLLSNEEAQISLFKEIRQNPVIVQPELQRIRKKFVKVNVIEDKISDTYDMKRIANLIGKRLSSKKQELRLAHLYDNNLNLLPEGSQRKLQNSDPVSMQSRY